MAEEIFRSTPESRYVLKLSLWMYGAIIIENGIIKAYLGEMDGG